jgi:hypothetical protein
MTEQPLVQAFINRARTAGILVDGDGRRAFEDVIDRAARRSGGLAGPNREALTRAAEVFQTAVLKAVAADRADSLGRAHVWTALSWICPLFPICD